MKYFDEEIFLLALISRTADAIYFSKVFEPSYLKSTEYAPVLQEIYSFARKTNESPSLKTLHRIFEEKDEGAYKLRYKHVLEKLERTSPDKSEILFVLDQARNIAITRSLKSLFQKENFIETLEEHDGAATVKSIQQWLASIQDTTTDRTMDIKQTIEHLISTAEFISDNPRIPFGIKQIDDWMGGGLRKKNLAIFLGASGHGKSNLLYIISHKIAAVEQKKVWLATNELTLEEVAERMLSRIRGIDLTKIINDPTIAYKDMDFFWKRGLDKRLYLTEYNRDTSTDDLESELDKMKILYGYSPDVLVLDYIERMQPAVSGYKRENEWSWLGRIARDLIRMAKKRNMLIITAAQMNRKGMDQSQELGMDSAQSSIRHLQEAAAVFAIQQIDIPNTDETALKIKPLKMRQSKRSSRAVVLRCNMSKLHISGEEVDLDNK